MPTELADLPLELLAQLLAPLVSRRDLCSAALVCRAWRSTAQQLLLRHVRLFGRDLAIAPLLFHTLVDHPHLAAMVRKLEVRVYPLSMKLRERQEMEDLAIRMLANCVAVEDLVWTRKGALTDRVFEAIVALPKLRSFECNAHTNLSPGSWDADHFLDLPPLRSLSLILPDRNVANLLPAFLAKQRSLAATSASRAGDDNVLVLEELSILCRESTVINDRVVAALAPSLANSRLTSLALAGCAKLTGAPLVSLLPTLPHLRHLALEACALDPSTFFPAAAPNLAALESLKLTHPGPRHPTLATFLPALESLLDHTHALTALTLYHSGASATGRREWPVLPLAFAQHVAATVGPRLRKFEVSGVLVGVEAIEALTERARSLKNLVLHLGQDFDLPRLTASFAHLASLRTLHLLSQRADISPDDVLSLAEQCSTTLRQIGFRNRVWLVRRTYSPAADAPAQVRFVETAGAFGAFRRNRYGAESDVESEAESGDEVGGASASASDEEDDEEDE
ncbi:uncharacterized protein RHOBADRAFT_53059 [Rhodotorula graminis WP1]|uniref:F-box domain-containing protein n=1 Tax=Rhodotorula graminis (strain WP1) TaxID=578459 RepID=A0A194S6E4_RHOGW|nr:uncharacterized protein RHOBADRAFT_53059 [Rhodotorula graminis WP1]KPV76065.1 hypothetical protein RHOBADRAFT_53059 [Rhodotorula graminis WP1]